MEPAFDVEQDEFGDRLKKIEEMLEDTNRQVRSMRRGQRWRSFASIAWWVIIIGISAFTYYAYVQPYVDQVVGVYGSAQDFQQQVQGFFGQYFGSSTRP